jgi:hypothetical protein
MPDRLPARTAERASPEQAFGPWLCDNAVVARPVERWDTKTKDDAGNPDGANNE